MTYRIDIPKIVRRELEASRLADARKGGRMDVEQTKRYWNVRRYGRFTPIWGIEDGQAKAKTEGDAKE
jgi:hypothetical protein